MRIITLKTLARYWTRHPLAKAGLEHWLKVAEAARWTCLADARATFPHADQVTVASGRRVVVFNVCGNSYRLITAIHYNRGLVFTLAVLTHAEYDKDKWKETL
jgi:mRNA interferase HigB